MKDFAPKIMAFVCNWCPHTAVECGCGARMAQKINVRQIGVLCSGMVDPGYVIKAFASGADGVLIAGCHPGDCHYLAGNIKALRRSRLLQRLLLELGVEKERFRMEWISHAESFKYAEVIDTMLDGIHRLGPFIKPAPAVDAVPEAQTFEKPRWA
jgi:F420-non-reducing hydrogenase iron-sulfur subunit